MLKFTIKFKIKYKTKTINLCIKKVSLEYRTVEQPEKLITILHIHIEKKKCVKQ